MKATVAADWTDRKKKPTVRDRARGCYQDGYGHRDRNDWNSGDLPAPFAEGDLVWLPEGATVADGRLRGLDGHGWFVVAAGFSIDEGDGWYFRVTRPGGNEPVSDRLHVVHIERANWDTEVNYMEPFELVETSDPTGLELRELKITTGWAAPKTDFCPTCGAKR